MYVLLIVLQVFQLILAFICGPHSCEWGNTVYFYVGIFTLMALFITPFFQKSWSAGKRLGVACVFLFSGIMVWVIGFIAGNFRIMCRLF